MYLPSYVFIPMIVLNCWTNGDHIFQCKKEFQICGDNRCCCKTNKALCDGKKEKLSFIPTFSNNLTSLTFVNNILPNLSKSSFTNISNVRLKELVIENDGVVNVSTDAFEDLQYLRILSIRENTINASQLFKAIGGINKITLEILELKKIGLSGNMSKVLIDALNGSALNRILLNQDHIKTVNIGIFAAFPNLAYLSLSNNNITEFNASSGHPTLQRLFLTQNKIAGFPPEFCQDNKSTFPNLEHLYLDHNLISVITNKYIRCLSSLKRLVLSANVLKHIPANLVANLPSFEDLRMNQMCGLGGHKVSINRYAFNSTTLRRLELGLNNIIFTRKYVEADIFQSCKELTHLDVKRNNMRKIRDSDIARIFSPLTKLEKLFLDANHLKYIPKYMLRNFTNLQFLSLDGNGIQVLGDSLLGPTNLQHLTLQGNNIRIVTPDSFPASVTKTLKKLNLENNPFACTCENLWFRNWAGDKGKPYGTNITLANWPGRYTCYTPSEWNEKRFVNYRPTETSCSQKKLIVIISISLGSVLVIVLISVPVGIRYRWHLMYAWFRLTKRTKDPERRPLLTGTNFERYIYVIYHDDDGNFVHSTLCNIIEREFGFKLFVWQRDADAGSMANIMFDAIESSECVLAILSNNFVTDGWCEFQLDLSLSKNNTTRKDCLTLVLLENLDVSLLRRSWCVTLVKNAKVYWCSDTESVNGRLCVEKLKTRLSSIDN